MEKFLCAFLVGGGICVIAQTLDGALKTLQNRQQYIESQEPQYKQQ